MISRVLSAAFLLVALSACHVEFPQVETARSMFGGQGNGVDEELKQFAWTLEFSGDSMTVYAVTVEAGTLFVNQDELRVLFDGTHVRAVSNLLPGRRDIVLEVGDGGAVSFFEEGQLLLDTTCEPWERAGSRGEFAVWEQRCASLDRPNRKLVRPDDAITRIEYTIHPLYPPIVLSRVHTEEVE